MSFKVVEVDSPRLEPTRQGQLIIKTRWVSLCGSDIPFFTGRNRFRTYPLQPGRPAHECVGRW